MTHETISMIISTAADGIQIATICEWICNNLLPAILNMAFWIYWPVISDIVPINGWANIKSIEVYMIYWMLSKSISVELMWGFSNDFWWWWTLHTMDNDHQSIRDAHIIASWALASNDAKENSFKF